MIWVSTPSWDAAQGKGNHAVKHKRSKAWYK